MSKIPFITSEAFTYDKTDKSFTGMMSTVAKGIMDTRERTSLFIKSQWTGKIKRFDLKGVDKSKDVWVYTFVAAAKDLKGYTAIIFND